MVSVIQNDSKCNQIMNVQVKESSAALSVSEPAAVLCLQSWPSWIKSA